MNDPHASRRLEVAQLELAIEKTTRAYARAADQLAALGSRLSRQQAELRFQKLVLRACDRSAPKQDLWP